jgi:hypothetical protein
LVHETQRGWGMNIRVAMPKTALGRVTGTLLILAVAALLIVFFAAVLVLAAVVIAGYVLRRIIVGRRSEPAVVVKSAPSEVHGSEVPARYEIVNDKEPGE